MERGINMDNKINDLVNAIKINELFHKKEVEEEKKKNCIIILAVVGIITLIAGIAFMIYKFVTPDYYEDDYNFDEDLLDDEDYEDFDDDSEDNIE